MQWNKHQVFCSFYQENFVHNLKLRYQDFTPDPHYRLSEDNLKKASTLFWIKARNEKKFWVKVQAGCEESYKRRMLMKLLGEDIANVVGDSTCWIYDKSRTVSAIVEDKNLYDFVLLHGRLGHSAYRSRKLFLSATVKNKRAKRASDIQQISLYTDVIKYDITDW